ncbi:MAG: hypothetical protein RR280_01445 [Bacteroidaceae bacterium]
MKEQPQKLVRMAKGEASFISLVERGANQTPIKIVKSDKSGASKMSINLSSLIRVSKSVSPNTEVVGYVVADGHTINPAFAALLGEVAEVKKASDTGEAGDIHVIKKAALETEGTELMLMEVSPEVTLIVKSFRPYSDDFSENATFKEIIQARSLPIWQIGEVISGLISDALYHADNKQDAINDMASIFEDGKRFTTELLQALPETVFKSVYSDESIIQKADTQPDPEQVTKQEGGDNGETNSPASDPAGETGGDNGGDGTGTVATTQGEEGSDANTGADAPSTTEPAAGTTPAANPAEPSTVEGQGGEQPTTVGKSSEQPVPALAPALDMEALITSITKAVQDNLAPQFAVINDQVQSIAKSSGAAEEQVKKALGSTIVGHVTKSDVSNPKEVEDSHTNYHIDTAYTRPKLK